MAGLHPFLECPKCRGALTAGEAELTCTRCQTRVPLVDGVPSFADPDFYWGEIDEERMTTLLRSIDEGEDIETAVRRVDTEPERGRFHHNVFGKDRADLRFLLPDLGESTALDLGAGMGAITFGLAPFCRHVVAVEGVLARARFIEKRRRRERISNITVVHADVNALPLRDAQFSVVIVNGLLEWVAMGTPKGHPRDIQLAFLRRVAGLLRPGGLVCIGIENRIGLNAFRGSLDHSGYSYTMLMPRQVADWYVRHKEGQYRSPQNRGGYRTYTYSYFGYRRLLSEAGLSRQQFFWVEPGYNHPRCWLPLVPCGPAVAFLAPTGGFETRKGRWLRRIQRALALVGGAKMLASNFIIIAQR